MRSPARSFSRQARVRNWVSRRPAALGCASQPPYRLKLGLMPTVLIRLLAFGGGRSEVGGSPTLPSYDLAPDHDMRGKFACRSFDHSVAQRGEVEAMEQGFAAAEQDWGHREVEFVDQTGL